MDPLRYTRSASEPRAPFPNIHNELRPETPGKNRTSRAVDIARAIDAGKRLQRIMGIAESVPFVTPPAVPKDLKHEFIARMKEYSLDNRVQNMGLDALSQAASMQERLLDTREENKGSIKAV